MINVWNGSTHEEVELKAGMVLKLGIEGEPTYTIEEWMELAEIETLEEMASYIELDCDFNVEVLK